MRSSYRHDGGIHMHKRLMLVGALVVGVGARVMAHEGEDHNQPKAEHQEISPEHKAHEDKAQEHKAQDQKAAHHKKDAKGVKAKKAAKKKGKKVKVEEPKTEMPAVMPVK